MVSTALKRNYATGAAANGVKTDMFTFFLLFFYTNIAGLEPALAGLAILVALCVDAITDPLMGTITDRTNSRFGRRHPFMFVSFIPLSIGYVLLFIPNPSWDLTYTYVTLNIFHFHELLSTLWMENCCIFKHTIYREYAHLRLIPCLSCQTRKNVFINTIHLYTGTIRTQSKLCIFNPRGSSF